MHAWLYFDFFPFAITTIYALGSFLFASMYFFSLILLFFLHSIAFLFVCLFVYLWGKCSLYFFFFFSTNFIILPNKCSSEFVDCVIASYLVYMYLCAFQCILSPLLVRKCLYISQHGFSAFLSVVLWCVPRI